MIPLTMWDSWYLCNYCIYWESQLLVVDCIVLVTQLQMHIILIYNSKLRSLFMLHPKFNYLSNSISFFLSVDVIFFFYPFAIQPVHPNSLSNCNFHHFINFKIPFKVIWPINTLYILNVLGHHTLSRLAHFSHYQLRLNLSLRMLNPKSLA